MRKKLREREHFRPTIFKILGTPDKLTAAAGLGTMMEVFDSTPLSHALSACLPKRCSNRSAGSYRMALIQICSFIYGHECLSDLEEFEDEPLLEEMMKGQCVAPRTLGDYLRDFEETHVDQLNGFLSHMSRWIRERLKAHQPEEFKPGALRIDIDSTSHEQEGSQMEGLAWNYEGKWCLDSQVCFDEMGFCHNVDLRPGNTKSGVGAKAQLERCFRGMKFKEEKYTSGDSAYCYQEPIEYCLSQGVKFTFTAHDGVTGWRERVGEITKWEEWKYSKKDLEKAQKSKKVLPKIDLGYFYHSPPWAPHIKLPIVVKRTWKEEEQLPLVTLPGHWKYYAVITNFNLFLKSLQDVMEFHNKRGKAENMIREEKYGYDLKHFPCQKMLANHAFLQLAMIAHNLLRWVALVMRPEKPHFAKKLRRRFIFIPAKVVRHARQTFLKMPEKFRKEVCAMRLALQGRLKPAFASSDG